MLRGQSVHASDVRDASGRRDVLRLRAFSPLLVADPMRRRRDNVRLVPAPVHTAPTARLDLWRANARGVLVPEIVLVGAGAMTPTRVILTTAVIVYAGLGVILAAVAIDAALCAVRPSRRCRGCRWSQTLIGRRVCA